MTVDRSLPTISSDPGGVNGSDWTGLASESLAAVWEHLGGVLTSVAQADVNVVTANLKYGTSFSAYTEPLTTILIPVAANTGAVTLNINSVGAIAIVRPDGTGLQAGDLTIGRPMILIYVQALNKFVYMNFVDYSAITTEIGQLKKKWRVVASGSVTASGTTLITLDGVQGAVGDILQLPSFDHLSLPVDIPQTDKLENYTNGNTTIRVTATTQNDRTHTINFYKDATLIGQMATLFSTNFTTWDYQSVGDLGLGNGFMYPLDDTSSHDYSISISAGGSCTLYVEIDAFAELFTLDGTFS